MLKHIGLIQEVGEQTHDHYQMKSKDQDDQRVASRSAGIYSTKQARVKCFQKVRSTVNKMIVMLSKGIKYVDQGLYNNGQNRSQDKPTVIWKSDILEKVQ